MLSRLRSGTFNSDSFHVVGCARTRFFSLSYAPRTTLDGELSIDTLDRADIDSTPVVLTPWMMLCHSPILLFIVALWVIHGISELMGTFFAPGTMCGTLDLKLIQLSQTWLSISVAAVRIQLWLSQHLVSSV